MNRPEPGRNQSENLFEPSRIPAAYRSCIFLKRVWDNCNWDFIRWSLENDSDIMLYPRGEKVKIRSIQVHGQEIIQAFPGQRVAVNLPGIGKEDISRGEILAAAGSMESTMMADVRLHLLQTAHRALKTRQPGSFLSWGSGTGVQSDFV